MVPYGPYATLGSLAEEFYTAAWYNQNLVPCKGRTPSVSLWHTVRH